MLRRLPYSVSLLALSSAMALGGLYAGPASAQRAGVTAAVNVDAERTPPGQTTRQVMIGDDIVYDELIETDAVGRAQVLMVDRTALTIGPNSSLTIDKFVYDPEKKSGDMGLTLRRGMLRFVGGRISKTNEVKVNTPVGVLGVRGGIALIRVVDQNAVDVTFLFGDNLAVYLDGVVVENMRRPGFKTRLTREGADEPWQVDSASITEDMQQLQGRAGDAGGLVQIPDESLVTLLTDGSLPSVDRDVLANAIGQLLGPTTGDLTPDGLTQVVSTTQQQTIDDTLNDNPLAAPSQFPVSGLARWTDQQQDIGVSNFTEFAGTSETIQLVAPDLVENTASIGFDPNLQLYYGSRAGSSSYPAAVWTADGTLQQLLQPMGIDARAWNYNANTGDIELVTFTSDLHIVERDANGELTGNYPQLIENMPGSPTDQSMPAYNPATDEFYAFGSGISPDVSVLDRATGNLQSTITLDFAAAGVSELTSYFIGYDPQQDVLIGVSGANAYIFGLDGSFIRSAPLTVIADRNFDAGYANGQLFVYDPGIVGFQGFDLFASYTDGEGFFSLFNDEGGVEGTAPNFITDAGFGPLEINNPFDGDDPRMYDHPTVFVTKLQALGVSPAIAERLAGPQIHTDDFVTLTYQSLINENDPMTVDLDGSLTIVAGSPYDLSGSGLMAYDLLTDPHRFSRHAFSLVGFFDVAGPNVTDIDFGLDASAYQTPLYIDMDRGKVFLASKVAQGAFANYSNYVFQAGVIAGDFSVSSGIDAGGGEIVLGSVRGEEFGSTQTFDAFHFEALGRDGDYALVGGDAYEIGDDFGPDGRDYVHVGQKIADPGLTLDDGSESDPIVNNQLLTAAYVSAGAGSRFSGFSQEGVAISASLTGMGARATPGSLTFDRAAGTVDAVIELSEGSASTTLDFSTSAFRSAYLSDSHYGLGSQDITGSSGGFLVSGKATSPDDACTCKYLHWGYWAYAEDHAPENPNASGLYVAGIPTPSVDMPVSGTATFTGVAEAAWRGASSDPIDNPNPTVYGSGTFSHTVNFATGTGSGTMTLNNDVFQSESLHTPSDPNINFAFAGDESRTGTGVGIFTGPQAKNLGAVFNIVGDGGYMAAGGIRAQRGDITPPPLSAKMSSDPGLSR